MRQRRHRNLPLPGPHRDMLIAIGLVIVALALLAVAMITRGSVGGL